MFQQTMWCQVATIAQAFKTPITIDEHVYEASMARSLVLIVSGLLRSIWNCRLTKASTNHWTWS